MRGPARTEPSAGSHAIFSDDEPCNSTETETEETPLVHFAVSKT